jgi:hypothetical protein
MLMAVAALIWLGYQFWRLLLGSTPIWRTSPVGAVDLKLLHRQVHDWFSEGEAAPYLPASYVILWPVLGWLDVTPARWLWAATTVVALGWLIHLILRESGADTPLERVFVALMPLSVYATGATIGNGQLIVHLLPMLVAGLILLKGRGGWRKDLLAVALVLVTLVKPTVSAPFFWIVVFLPGSLWPALLVSTGYLALTLFAMQVPGTAVSPLLELPIQIMTLVRQVLDTPTRSVGWAAQDRYADLPIWLTRLGLTEWILPTTLLMLAGLGLWVYRHRHRDIWLLLGVSALVTRFLMYHRWYDDLLILLPMVALFRFAKRGASTEGSGVVAGVLLAITMLVMLAPGGLYLFPSPWNRLYAIWQAIVWIIMLVFLLYYARTEKNARHAQGGWDSGPA